jgi:hypothetical protein
LVFFVCLLALLCFASNLPLLTRSFSIEYTKVFMQRLLDLIYEVTAPSVVRQAALNYLSSFVARANYLQLE